MLNHDDDSFETILRTATNQVLVELNLTGRVRINDIQPTIDSDYFVVGLTEKTGPQTSKYHSFRIDAAEAVSSPEGDTLEGTKPLVLREVLKLFPESRS